MELIEFASGLSERVNGSALAAALQRETWLVPTSQSVHIVALSILTAATLTICLRVLGVQSRSGRSVLVLIKTLMPWIYGSLCVLLLTGVAQILLEPMRQFSSPAFWLKMLLILVVLTYTIWFARTVRAHAAEWSQSASSCVAAKFFAASSMTIWIAIIFCGRFIAYTHK